MTQYGQLIEGDGCFEFRLDSHGLVVRGDHPEWVLLAVSEVLGKSAKREAESRVIELESLIEFEAATACELDSARLAVRDRFSRVPQCSVTVGRIDYNWAASVKTAATAETDETTRPNPEEP